MCPFWWPFHRARQLSSKKWQRGTIIKYKLEKIPRIIDDFFSLLSSVIALSTIKSSFLIQSWKFPCKSLIIGSIICLTHNKNVHPFSMKRNGAFLKKEKIRRRRWSNFGWLFIDSVSHYENFDCCWRLLHSVNELKMIVRLLSPNRKDDDDAA